LGCACEKDSVEEMNKAEKISAILFNVCISVRR
jgi:hypothetical protein